MVRSPSGERPWRSSRRLKSIWAAGSPDALKHDPQHERVPVRLHRVLVEAVEQRTGGGASPPGPRVSPARPAVCRTPRCVRTSGPARSRSSASSAAGRNHGVSLSDGGEPHEVFPGADHRRIQLHDPLERVLGFRARWRRCAHRHASGDRPASTTPASSPGTAGRSPRAEPAGGRDRCRPEPPRSASARAGAAGGGGSSTPPRWPNPHRLRPTPPRCPGGNRRTRSWSRRRWLGDSWPRPDVWLAAAASRSPSRYARSATTDASGDRLQAWVWEAAHAARCRPSSVHTTESVRTLRLSGAATTDRWARGTRLSVVYSPTSSRTRAPSRARLPETTLVAPSRRASAAASAKRNGLLPLSGVWARTVRRSTVRMSPTPSRLALTVLARSRPSRIRAVSPVAGANGSTASTDAESRNEPDRAPRRNTHPAAPAAAPTTRATAAMAPTSRRPARSSDGRRGARRE